MTFEEALTDAVAACREQWREPGGMTSHGVADVTITADVMFVVIKLDDVVDRPSGRGPGDHSVKA